MTYDYNAIIYFIQYTFKFYYFYLTTDKKYGHGYNSDNGKIRNVL